MQSKFSVHYILGHKNVVKDNFDSIDEVFRYSFVLLCSSPGFDITVYRYYPENPEVKPDYVLKISNKPYEKDT